MKRLQHRDRLVIERGKKAKKSLRQISKETNIPKSTIHNEIKRFHKSFGDCKYNAFIAQILSDLIRIRLKVSQRKTQDKSLLDAVEKYLKKGSHLIILL